MINRVRVLAATVLLLAVCGCSDSGGRLVGKWRQVPQGRVYNFQSGGHVTGIVNGLAVTGSWEVKEDKDDTMVVNIATSRGDAPDSTLKFEGPDKFLLSDAGGPPLQFERQK